jgi:hypothetical protein
MRVGQYDQPEEEKLNLNDPYSTDPVRSPVFNVKVSKKRRREEECIKDIILRIALRLIVNSPLDAYNYKIGKLTRNRRASLR